VLNGGGTARASLGSSPDGVRDAVDSAQGAVAAAAERQQQMADEYRRQQEGAMRQQYENGEGYGGQGRRR